MNTLSNLSLFPFYSRVVNLTDTKFDNKEMELLNKGLKYAPDNYLTPKLIQSLAIDTEIALLDHPIQIKTEIAVKINKLSSEPTKLKTNYQNNKIINGIKTKINTSYLLSLLMMS